MESIGDGVVVLNKDLRIVLMNPSAQEITGFSFSMLRGKRLHDVLRLTTEGKVKATIDLADVLEKSKRQTMCQHLLLERKNQDIIPVTYCAAPVNGHGGPARGVVLTIRDARGEYAISKMKSEFVSIVSHQMRTPLAAIKWFLESVIDDPHAQALTERQHEYVSQAFQSNERMITLVNDLLNVSRLESGKVKCIPKAVDSVAIFRSAISEIETYAHARNVTVDCRFLHAKLPRVRADASHLRQVIQNILANAVQYTRGRQTVTIDADVRSDEVVFSVADHGIGIPLREQRRVFEPFFRAANAIETQAEGSGLGLYICSLLLKINHGRIWLQSVEGEGTTFFIALPRAVYQNQNE